VQRCPNRHARALSSGSRLFDAANLVMGSMIGSGVFLVSADIARQVGGGLWQLVVWAAAGVMTVLAARDLWRAGGHVPRRGGQYVYLREALGRMPAFLYGWTLFLVIQTGTVAAVAVAFAASRGPVPAISAASHPFGDGVRSPPSGSWPSS